MRSYWSRVGPNPVTGVLIRENRNVDAQRKGSRVKKQTFTPAEIGVIHLQVGGGGQEQVCSRPLKEAALPTPGCQPSSLQD